MALWQYTLSLLPRASYESLAPCYPPVRGHDLFDDEPFWRLNPTSEEIFYSFDTILKRSNSWSHDIRLYGSVEGSCLSVLVDERNLVCSVSLRIDFRTHFEGILDFLVEFCLSKSFVLLDESLNYVPLDHEQLKATIWSSPQVRLYDELSGRRPEQ